MPFEGRVVVEHDGRHEDVLQMTLGDELAPGDWVVIHSGFVLEKISHTRAADALAIRATPGASAIPDEKELAP